MHSFYYNLYKRKPIANIIDAQNFNGLRDKIPKLSDQENALLSAEITIEELHDVVLKSKNNKTPGPDGFSNEFLKIFWPDIGLLLLKLMKSYREKGIIDENHISGIITCIPKGNKLRSELKNWRPITLLNSIYKFYSSVLSERIKPLLSKLIHPDQKGFIYGRFIGDNSYIIQECEFKNLKGLIVLIDFEKAFDSLSWDYIQNSLKLFNFNDSIIKWVRSLQLNSSSKILQNGHLSEKINLGRGCRQGDPISPYLFVLAAEFLAEAVRSNKNITGITIYEQEHKVSQYADDTSLLLNDNEENLRECMAILSEFELISGLKVNKEKTKVIKIGKWGDNRTILCRDLNLEWTQKFDCLGISYDIGNMERISDMNIEKKIGEIRKTTALWNSRFLTPFGKVIIVKSLLISKFTHVLLSLPSPSTYIYKVLENIFMNFIWGNKQPKFRREILELPIAKGGLCLTNLVNFDLALKVTWLKRVQSQNSGWAEFAHASNIHKIVIYGDLFAKKLSISIRNKFWADVAYGAHKLLEVSTP